MEDDYAFMKHIFVPILNEFIETYDNMQRNIYFKGKSFIL